MCPVGAAPASAVPAAASGCSGRGSGFVCAWPTDFGIGRVSALRFHRVCSAAGQAAPIARGATGCKLCGRGDGDSARRTMAHKSCIKLKMEYESCEVCECVYVCV